MNKKSYGAWVSPKGELFEVWSECNHEGIAKEITGGLMPNLEDDGYIPETSYLLASGWMRIVYEGNGASFQAKNYTRHLLQWTDLYTDPFLTNSESWEDFQARSAESYNFSPIYPFGENSINYMTFVTLTCGANLVK